MKLSVITINYNNKEGLRRTLDSVAAQSYRDIEHIIINGGSTDGSVDVIKEYVSASPNSDPFFKHTIKWVSEKDNGIYNAMNKGIEIALGRRVVSDNHTSSVNSLNVHPLNESLCDYIQILNSGDILAAPDVTERMMNALSTLNFPLSTENRPAIFYGNMMKDYGNGKLVRDNCGGAHSTESFMYFYRGTLNHDCCYIRRDLFDTYGLYDENLKIVSDWKWFLQAIGLGHVKPVYVDIDVTIFDASGISESNLELRNKERRQVLEEVLPPAVLADYDKHAFDAEQMNRLRKRHLYWLVYFIERVLFKLEKWHILR